MKKFFSFWSVVATVLLSAAGPVWACAVCFGDSDTAADGYNASVLFLMSTPYLVVGSIAGGLFLMVRRAAQRNGTPVGAAPSDDYETGRTAVDE